MMYENISESFNADFEDDSVEEVIIFPFISSLAPTYNLLTW